MPTTTPRTIYNRAAGICRQVNALAREPAEWDPNDLHLLTCIEAAVASARERVIYGLRDHGSTDKEIGEAMGVTQQAVSKRWPGGGRYVGAAGRYRSTASVQHDDS